MTEQQKNTTKAESMPPPKPKYGPNGLPIFDALDEVKDPDARIVPGSKLGLAYAVPEEGWLVKVGKLKPWLLMLFIIGYAATFFPKESFKTAEFIDPLLYEQPIQKSVNDSPLYKPEAITFRQNNLDYELTPRFNYEIRGLVLSQRDYKAWYNYSRNDIIFDKELCLAWGANVKNKSHQNKGLKVYHDERACQFSNTGALDFKPSEFSNNRLIISDPNLKRIAESIQGGDQVRIRGKLVYAEVKKQAGEGGGQGKPISWNTSTNRNDIGPNASEIIYVEDLEILKTGNENSRQINQNSLYGILGIIVWAVIEALFSLSYRPQYETIT